MKFQWNNTSCAHASVMLKMRKLQAQNAEASCSKCESVITSEWKTDVLRKELGGRSLWHISCACVLIDRFTWNSFRGGLSKLKKNVIVTFGAASHVTFCLPTKSRYIQTTLFGTVLQEKVGTIYDHPTTQYEQFIERYTADTRVVASQKQRWSPTDK